MWEMTLPRAVPRTGQACTSVPELEKSGQAGSERVSCVDPKLLCQYWPEVCPRSPVSIAYLSSDNDQRQIAPRPRRARELWILLQLAGYRPSQCLQRQIVESVLDGEDR